MPWLWYVAPVAVVLLWFVTSLRGRHEARRDRELARFRARFATADAGDGYLRAVDTLPGALRKILPAAGGGVPIASYELAEKLAYLSVMAPNATTASEYQVVLAKLAKAGPELTVYPVPLAESTSPPKNRVLFKKDPDFMSLFIVEGPNAKAIGAWLSRPIRDALRDMPEAWLYVRDRVVAVAAYGAVDAERLHDLLVTADAVFAERGAEGAPSLLPDSDATDEDDSDDAGDNDEDDSDDAGDSDRDADADAAPRAEADSARKA